jgi:hypothetical protein
MASRDCIVRFKIEDAMHEVRVSAESLYEAAARALCAFREDDWTMSDSMKTGYLEIIVRQPEIRHKLLLRDFEAWLERTGGNTKQLQHRAFLRRLLRGENLEG